MALRGQNLINNHLTERGGDTFLHYGTQLDTQLQSSAQVLIGALALGGGLGWRPQHCFCNAYKNKSHACFEGDVLVDAILGGEDMVERTILTTGFWSAARSTSPREL